MQQYYYSNGKKYCYACPNGGVRKSHGCIGTATGCCTKDVNKALFPQFITQPYPKYKEREPYKFEVGKMYYVTNNPLDDNENKKTFGEWKEFSPPGITEADVVYVKDTE